VSPRVALTFAFALAGCGTSPGGDDTGPAAGDTAAACADAAALSWATFGAGFFVQNCQSCHASTTADRHGAPPGVHFGDEASVRAQAGRIRARATGDAPDMPPSGGVAATERDKLTLWLTCGAR
jgi:uncharacterized membrane protein